jgi:hypothetical protein
MAFHKIAVSPPTEMYERIAAAAVTPGMLIELTTADKYQAHSGAGLACASLFALENSIVGGGIGDAYATGDVVKAGAFASGHRVYALLADGENAAIGNKLESNGDGYLRVVDTDSSAATIKVGSVRFQALEALDMSGSSGADPASQRILIAVL